MHAANYVEKELSVSLSKSINELPISLRNQEIFLRGIEALLSNLLHDKFAEDNPHQIIDHFCEHVHMSLKDLSSRLKKFPSKK